ncbi:MAG: carbohydrate kinase family protein [Bacteroidales bacterium]|nr:carbohydrate kinase family protein [Bacteroidales bacterium]
MAEKIIVSGVGCTLVDSLYNNVSFSAQSFITHLSKAKGDGGLTPGHLVFKEEFEKFEGKAFDSTIRDIISDRNPDKINIGGPGVVPIIHAAQLSDNKDCEYHIYGGRGDDSNGHFIKSLLERTTVVSNNYITLDNETPSTLVLSDPNYKNSGERIFINSIGAAWNYLPRELDEDFFASDIVVFGGTALVPLIHDSLSELLEKAKSKGCLTIVNTVYDFRNEKANPNSKWPLGKSDNSYGNIDLLLMDLEEALRLSGKSNINDAMQFFRDKETGAVIITRGTENIVLYSKGSIFKAINHIEMPISDAVTKELKQGIASHGDTTGCGDNFVGGVIASLVSQLQSGISSPDLKEASAWGVVSGGTSCFYMGGMYEEKSDGEKRKMIEPYYKLYKKQIKK